MIWELLYLSIVGVVNTWLLLTSWATDELVLVEHILHFVVFLCNDLILSFEYFKLGIKLVIGSVEVNDSSFKHFPLLFNVLIV